LTEIKLRFQKNKTRFGNTHWTAGYIIEKCRDSLAKLTTEPVSSNLSRWIQNEWIGSDRIGLDQPMAVLRPEQSHDGESRGGAIVRERYLMIHSVTSRKKSTGMEWGTRRARQGKRRRQSRSGDGVELGMADGSDYGSSVASLGRRRSVVSR
jgi:hypothetical protein